jgi:hypothetical protein
MGVVGRGEAGPDRGGGEDSSAPRFAGRFKAACTVYIGFIIFTFLRGGLTVYVLLLGPEFYPMYPRYMLSCVFFVKINHVKSDL